MLVQGWFVLMSSELYPLPPGDKRTDPLELRRCRDFILCHYALYKPLDKQDTLKLLGLQVEEFNEMFGPISSFYLRGKHSFKYSEDRLFIRDHLELCHEHSSQWTQVGLLLLLLLLLLFILLLGLRDDSEALQARRAP